MLKDTNLKFEIPKLTKTNRSDFIDFWKKEYSYFNEDLYNDNIGQKLNKERILSLYKWKNGHSKISQRKLQSIERVYLERLEDSTKVTNMKEGEEYLNKLDGGAIWDIFWLHCLNPKLFPIFDQHTYRSMKKIIDGKPSEIPNNRLKKIDIYFKNYIPFFKSLSSSSSTRDVDKALFAYGRFLKRGFSGK